MVPETALNSPVPIVESCQSGVKCLHFPIYLFAAHAQRRQVYTLRVCCSCSWCDPVTANTLVLLFLCLERAVICNITVDVRRAPGLLIGL